jgi:hypothetical protein
MNPDEPTPMNPDDTELAQLFGQMASLADQVAARIPQEEIEARLRRVQRRARQQDPALRTGRLSPFIPESAGISCEPAADAERIILGPAADARLRAAEQLLAAAHQEAAALRADARRTLTLASAAHAEAASARAEAEQARREAHEMRAAATQLVEQARHYDDSALDRAATIIRNAQAHAAHARAEADETLAQARQIRDQLHHHPAPEGSCAQTTGSTRTDDSVAPVMSKDFSDFYDCHVALLTHLYLASRGTFTAGRLERWQAPVWETTSPCQRRYRLTNPAMPLPRLALYLFDVECVTAQPEPPHTIRWLHALTTARRYEDAASSPASHPQRPEQIYERIEFNPGAAFRPLAIEPPLTRHQCELI